MEPFHLPYRFAIFSKRLSLLSFEFRFRRCPRTNNSDYVDQLHGDVSVVDARTKRTRITATSELVKGTHVFSNKLSSEENRFVEDRDALR